MATLINGETYTLTTPELKPMNLEEKVEKMELEENEPVKHESTEREPEPSLNPADAEELLEEEEEEEDEDEEMEVTPLSAADAKKKGTKKKVTKPKSEGQPKPKRGGRGKKNQQPKKDTEADKKHTNKGVANPNATTHVAKQVIENLGNIKALPSEIDGQKITYLPSGAGAKTFPKSHKMVELPKDSVTVFERWNKVTGVYGDSFCMYVKDQEGVSYWSNSRVTAILLGGFVDPEKQYFTISRLADGSFVYGVIDRI